MEETSAGCDDEGSGTVEVTNEGKVAGGYSCLQLAY
jgi:hypothetical protein